MVRGYTRLVLKMDLKWQAPLPDGPKILTANHPSTTDPFYMLSLVREPISILVMEGVFKIPVLGRFIRSSGHVRVSRVSGTCAFNEGLSLLNAGWSIGVFPECGQPPKVKTGAVRMALTAGVPIIPIGIYLINEKIWYRPLTMGNEQTVSRLYLIGPYAVTVGKPMTFTGDVEDRANVRVQSERLLEQIHQLVQYSRYRLNGDLQALLET
jgi:1-acyl-sn-glycerol-3-phosphate acyltransferase